MRGGGGGDDAKEAGRKPRAGWIGRRRQGPALSVGFLNSTGAPALLSKHAAICCQLHIFNTLVCLVTP